MVLCIWLVPSHQVPSSNPRGLGALIYAKGFTRDAIEKCGKASLGFPHVVLLGKKHIYHSTCHHRKETEGDHWINRNNMIWRPPSEWNDKQHQNIKIYTKFVLMRKNCNMNLGKNKWICFQIGYWGSLIGKLS